MYSVLKMHIHNCSNNFWYQPYLKVSSLRKLLTLHVHSVKESYCAHAYLRIHEKVSFDGKSRRSENQGFRHWETRHFLQYSAYSLSADRFHRGLQCISKQTWPDLMVRCGCSWWKRKLKIRSKMDFLLRCCRIMEK